jgi:hypothetical protein
MGQRVKMGDNKARRSENQKLEGYGGSMLFDFCDVGI